MSAIPGNKLTKAQLAELETIRKNNGGMLKPADIVAFAQNPATALHRMFEWNGNEAARKYRLLQAQEIIRVAVVVLPNTNTPIRAYVSLHRDRKSGRGYRATSNVLSSTQMRQELLDEALEDMRIFRARYSTFKQLAGVFAAMASASKALAAAKKKTKKAV